MADTRIQVEVEKWVRDNWLPKSFGLPFREEKRTLRSGGMFKFDAVSEDNRIIATISTSRSLTSGGKNGVGKMMKLRADMLFLSMADAQKRLIVLTETDMYDRLLSERQAGRIPDEIEVILAVIPDDLRSKLQSARNKSSLEVRPRRV